MGAAALLNISLEAILIRGLAALLLTLTTLVAALILTMPAAAQIPSTTFTWTLEVT
jgi:hypothetical protein